MYFIISFFRRTTYKRILQNGKQLIILIFFTNFLSCRRTKSSTISHWVCFNFSKLCYINLCYFCYTGIYQLKRERSYTEECCKTANLTGEVNYNIQRCREFPNIIRVPNQSAHITRMIYHLIIRFSSDQILDWWCDCKCGNRFVGCCSHVASVVWFLSYARWQRQTNCMPSGNSINFFIDAGELLNLSDSSDKTDDDDDDEDNPT